MCSPQAWGLADMQRKATTVFPTGVGMNRHSPVCFILDFCSKKYIYIPMQYVVSHPPSCTRGSDNPVTAPICATYPPRLSPMRTPAGIPIDMRVTQ